MVSSNNDPSSTDRIYVILYLDPIFPFFNKCEQHPLVFWNLLYLVVVLSFFNLVYKFYGIAIFYFYFINFRVRLFFHGSRYEVSKIMS